MDKAFTQFCQILQRLFKQLKPKNQDLSFLLVIGSPQSGKTNLLRQSQLHHIQTQDKHIGLYYNQHGVVVEINDQWLNARQSLMENILKQLNRSSSGVRINGIILSIDIQDILESKTHPKIIQNSTSLLSRFTNALGYCVDCSILVTKMDKLAGFCDFFQYEHQSELRKPLGFSLHPPYIGNYPKNYEPFIELLQQQIIDKVHPVRSSVKRAQIREFPAQMNYLIEAIATYIEQIAALKTSNPCALYFTSSEQGGVIIDKIHQQIQKEYALTIATPTTQSTNYRSFFIDGAIRNMQLHCKVNVSPWQKRQRWLLGAVGSSTAICLGWILYQYWQTTHILDKTSQALLTFEVASRQPNNTVNALYHLTQANEVLGQISTNSISATTLNRVKKQMQLNTQNEMYSRFVPQILATVETVIQNSQNSFAERFVALKIYLMLGNPEKSNIDTIKQWFEKRWHRENPSLLEKKNRLLAEILRQPMQPLPINKNVVRDTQIYFNALPESYLFYQLAKDRFPQNKNSISIPGIILPTHSVPDYLTRKYFDNIVAILNSQSDRIIQDSWVLEKAPNAKNLKNGLLQAYFHEYITFWNTIYQNSMPEAFNSYEQGIAITQALKQNQSFAQLLKYVQNETAPFLNAKQSDFNRNIASQFSSLQFVDEESVSVLSQDIENLERFFATLSALPEPEKTAFELTKAYFNGQNSAPVLEHFNQHMPKLPTSLQKWAGSIIHSTHTLLMQDTKNYINKQWQQEIFPAYEQHIASRYPFSNTEKDVSIDDFNLFFANNGILDIFSTEYIFPFLDTTTSQWQRKVVDGFSLPVSEKMIDGLMQANIIRTMFFHEKTESQFQFSIHQLNLDPVISELQLNVGDEIFKDDHDNTSFGKLRWPASNASLSFETIDGGHYQIEEQGPWGLFRLLNKMNVLADDNEPDALHVQFAINGHSGHYLIRAGGENKLNPLQAVDLVKSMQLPRRVVG